VWISTHHLEKLVSTIQDLTASVTKLTAAIGAQPVPGTVSVLTIADQAELDANVANIDALTASETAEPAS
jgi:hypothetical protein